MRGAKMTDFDKMTKNFLLGETQQRPADMMSHLQALEETLGLLQPRSQSDTRRVEIAHAHLREMKRRYKRLVQENKDLQEKVNLLEEEKTNAKIEEDYS